MLETVFYLVALVNRFVEAFIKPLYVKYGWDKSWLMYVAWVLAGILVGLADVNLFAEYFIKYPLVGYILTAIVAGGGANLLNDATG